MSVQPPTLLLGWAGPEAEYLYDASRLSSPDRDRADLPRGARALRDWRVSRALKQRWLPCYPAASHSLSHSEGQACLAIAPRGRRLGVDIERFRPRRLESAADWAFTAQERHWLASLKPSQALRVFYVLWTLKEALIKAGGLDFPADLRRVGLAEDGALRAPGSGWRAATFWRAGGWVVSVAWETSATMVEGAADKWPERMMSGGPKPHAQVASRCVVGRKHVLALMARTGLSWLPGLEAAADSVLAGAYWNE